jgi:hypothetical protein
VAATPRFLIVQRTAQDHSAPPIWPGAAHGAIDSVAAPSPGGRWVSWRLLGRNNREMGRSPRVFDSVTEAFADADAARTALMTGGAKPVVIRSLQTGWTWRWAVDDVTWAVAARTYLRRRDAVSSAAQFLVDAAAAQTPGEERPPVMPLLREA